MKWSGQRSWGGGIAHSLLSVPYKSVTLAWKLSIRKGCPQGRGLSCVSPWAAQAGDPHLQLGNPWRCLSVCSQCQPGAVWSPPTTHWGPGNLVALDSGALLLPWKFCTSALLDEDLIRGTGVASRALNRLGRPFWALCCSYVLATKIF